MRDQRPDAGIQRGTTGESRYPAAAVGGDDRWPVWKLAVMLYIFAAGAVAINLFMLGLLGQSVGLTAWAPASVVLWAIPLGVPAAWLSGRWARRLLDEGAT